MWQNNLYSLVFYPAFKRALFMSPSWNSECSHDKWRLLGADKFDVPRIKSEVFDKNSSCAAYTDIQCWIRSMWHNFLYPETNLMCSTCYSLYKECVNVHKQAFSTYSVHFNENNYIQKIQISNFHIITASHILDLLTPGLPGIPL